MIRIPDICGTCKGATRSLEVVYEIYERELQKENPKRIVLYKELLHNEKVISELEELGIIVIDNLEELDENDIVIIRAHGEGEDTFLYLKEHNIEFYDATCPNVKKIHESVKEKYDAGYEIIIIGSSNHPEVEGINGWCHNEGVIISSKDDITNIGDNINKFIVVQTTFNKNLFDELCKDIKKRFPSFNIEINNSLCGAVERICLSSMEIAKKSDVMFVIGGKDSSNTKELYKRMQEYTTSYKFSNINDFYEYIKSSDITTDNNIGITGGSSTPIKEIYSYKYLLSFMSYYNEKIKDIKNEIDNSNKSLVNDSDNEIIKDIINYFIDLNSDGKYIRGTLISLGYFLASNKKDKEYLKLASAYETFHTSLLIHDDIIDNARLRRGKETIPRRICGKYLNEKIDETYQKDVLVLANSMGICSGDLGFYESFNMIVNNCKDNPNLASILSYFNDIAIKTIKGEIIDVMLPFQNKYKYYRSNEKDITDIYELKTSWYTITGPFMLGYLLGGGEYATKMVDILNKIGVAFQIKDDILGIFGENDIILKSNTSDIEEFKQTLLYSYILNTPYEEEFLKLYGKKNINEKELNRVRDLLIDSESYNNTLDYLDKLCNDAVEDIDLLDIDDDLKDILKGLIIFINIREK